MYISNAHELWALTFYTVYYQFPLTMAPQINALRSCVDSLEFYLCYAHIKEGYIIKFRKKRYKKLSLQKRTILVLQQFNFFRLSIQRLVSEAVYIIFLLLLYFRVESKRVTQFGPVNVINALLETLMHLYIQYLK